MRRVSSLLSTSLMALTLGSCAATHTAAPPALRTGKVSWRFEGLDRLDAARDSARRSEQLLLVGLSGGPD